MRALKISVKCYLVIVSGFLLTNKGKSGRICAKTKTGRKRTPKPRAEGSSPSAPAKA